MGADIEAMERVEGVDVLCRPQDSNVLLVAVGPLAAIALTAAARLRERGVAVAVVDPRWVLPVPEQVVKLASDVELVVTPAIQRIDPLPTRALNSDGTSSSLRKCLDVVGHAQKAVRDLPGGHLVSSEVENHQNLAPRGAV